MSVESQWASREEVQALKEARAEDRQRWAADRAADRERIAKLEVQLDESDKRLATKADLEQLRSDFRLWLVIGVVFLAAIEDINLIAVLRQLLRLGGAP